MPTKEQLDAMAQLMRPGRYFDDLSFNTRTQCIELTMASLQVNILDNIGMYLSAINERLLNR
jgi:hypothetical protein